MAIINGTQTEDANGMNFYNYLVNSGYNTERIAVELNGEILPKKNFKDTVISNSDKIEIVAFVGGG